eukprot:6203949-Pleurochrysis_carterae.AAC.1
MAGRHAGPREQRDLRAGAERGENAALSNVLENFDKRQTVSRSPYDNIAHALMQREARGAMDRAKTSREESKAAARAAKSGWNRRGEVGHARWACRHHFASTCTARTVLRLTVGFVVITSSALHA